MRRARRFLAPAALLAFSASLAMAQAPAAPRFTLEEMLKLKRVSDPQLSPDGRLVAYVVTDVSLEKNSRANHLWLVPVAGGAAMPVLRSDRTEDTPRWSPDGKAMAFVSTRGGSSQVWVAEVGSGGFPG